MITVTPNADILQHHGVKGQSWGRRKYQNEDGSLTELGRQHYGVGEAQTNQRYAKAQYKNAKLAEKYAKSDKARLEAKMDRNMAKAELDDAKANAKAEHTAAREEGERAAKSVLSRKGKKALKAAVIVGAAVAGIAIYKKLNGGKDPGVNISPNKTTELATLMSNNTSNAGKIGTDVSKKVTAYAKISTKSVPASNATKLATNIAKPKTTKIGQLTKNQSSNASKLATNLAKPNTTKIGLLTKNQSSNASKLATDLTKKKQIKKTIKQVRAHYG